MLDLDMSAWLKGLSTFALVLDMIGVTLLYFYGVPPSDSRFSDDGALLVEELSDDFLITRERYRKRAKVGFSFLLMGFSLQLGLSIFQYF